MITKLGDKIKIYLPQQQVHEVIGNYKLTIQRTKMEDVFVRFRNENDIGFKIAKAFALTSPLRTMLFLNHKVRSIVDYQYPLSIIIPIMFCHKDLQMYIKDESIKNVRKEAEKLRSEYDGLLRAVTMKFLSMVITDKLSISYIRKGKYSEAEKRVTALLKEREKEVVNILKDFYDKITRYGYYSVLEYLLTLYENITNAIDNFELLRKCYKNEGDMVNEIKTAIKRISQEEVIVKCSGGCLSCYFQYGTYVPFSFIASNVKEAIIYKNCPRCGEDVFINFIELFFPRGVDITLYESAKYFHEVVIGMVLASLDNISKVYVHKKINGYEVDVLGITEDGKVVAVEVSTVKISHFFDRAPNKVNRLRDVLPDKSKIFFVTGLSIDEYLTIGKKAVVFTFKHLAKLEEFLREHIKTM